MFDKTYCINLDKRPDRWEECQEEFKRIGLKVERFAGIDGNFNQSQYNCIKKASKNKSSLILEDDVMFSGYEGLSESLNDLPQDWDLVSLGANLAIQHQKKVSNRLYYYENGWSTHAVGYSQKLMKWIAGNFNPDGGVVYDEWLRRNVLPKFNCYIVNPMVAFQRPSFSDLLNRYMDYTNVFNKSKQMLA